VPGHHVEQDADGQRRPGHDDEGDRHHEPGGRRAVEATARELGEPGPATKMANDPADLLGRIDGVSRVRRARQQVRAEGGDERDHQHDHSDAHATSISNGGLSVVVDTRRQRR
jgi:hypothetical protein